MPAQRVVRFLALSVASAGGAGYLPPKHLYEQGGYEIRSTGFGPQAADMLVKKTLQMLSDL